MRNTALRSVLLVGLLAIVLSACSAPPPGAVAVVNGVEISQDRFEQFVLGSFRDPEGRFASMSREQAQSELFALQQQKLQALVGALLVDQLAEEVGVSLTEEELDEEFDRQVQLQGGDEGFQQALREFGISEEEFRIQVRAQALFQKVQQQIFESIEVTDEEIEELFGQRQAAGQYERADVSHILVETEDEAAEIVQLIESGEATFEELAEERSQDPGSASLGGALGMQPRGSYVEPFEEAVWSAEEGALVGPVETQFGFHVIRVNEFEERTLDDVYSALREEIAGQRANPEFQQLQTEFLERAEVELDSRFGRFDASTGRILPPTSLVPYGRDPAAPVSGGLGGQPGQGGQQGGSGTP